MLRSCLCVGIFASCLLPLLTALLAIRNLRTWTSIALIFLSFVPMYATSCGPVIAFFVAVYPDAETTPNWAHALIEYCYPVHIYLANETEIGRAVAVYTHDWIALVYGGSPSDAKEHRW